MKSKATLIIAFGQKHSNWSDDNEELTWPKVQKNYKDKVLSYPSRKLAVCRSYIQFAAKLLTLYQIIFFTAFSTRFQFMCLPYSKSITFLMYSKFRVKAIYFSREGERENFIFISHIHTFIFYSYSYWLTNVLLVFVKATLSVRRKFVHLFFYFTF